MTSGSPPTTFAQNKQNEPAVAVDPLNSDILAAGANEEIDVEACNAGDPTTCPFTAGVGTSGVYFSMNGGDSWTQPTYQGWTARDCLGPADCNPHIGDIGTLPKYYESGLVSDGDPSVAFGPRTGPGGFSWSNGARLYYANLTASFGGSRRRNETGFKGFEAIAVSRTDNIAAAAANNQNAWLPPVIATRQSSATFSDHEQITADDAQTSKFFGNVYVCFAMFRSTGSAPEPIAVARSTDAGDTWTTRQISQATNTTQTIGRQDCNIRTDSRGVVYVVWEGGFKKQLAVLLARSFDGGRTFEKPRAIGFFNEVGLPDPASGDITFDGLAGSRTSAIPWIDIANGAPSGSSATNEVVISWNDGPTPTDTNPGPNERVKVAYSNNGGGSFTITTNAAEPTDRPDFPAIGISPNGEDVFLVYMAFLQPWLSTTANPRSMQGVVRHADSPGSTAPTGWSTEHRGAVGDARGSSANAQTGEFLGDYNYIDVSQQLGYAVWNDVRDAADCPAEDAYRQSLSTDTPLPRPAPNADCPPTFGNSDIFGAGFGL